MLFLWVRVKIGGDCLLDNLKITPDSVIIYGPNTILDKIGSLKLSGLSLSDIKSNFEEEVSVLLPENINNLKISSQKAIISARVDKFTEGSFKVPYQINNLPENVQVSSLTKYIEVVYVVALSKFDEVSEESFKVSCNFNVTQQNNLNYLIPKLVEKPSFIKSYKLVPNQIDFLIKK